jgi:hypothetical protein
MKKATSEKKYNMLAYRGIVIDAVMVNQGPETSVVRDLMTGIQYSVENTALFPQTDAGDKQLANALMNMLENTLISLKQIRGMV